MKAPIGCQETSVVTDYILKILELDICVDTMVGNEMRRGPTRALFMDEIYTGLDSSTMFQIVNSLRQSVHILGRTVLISILQPAPETYDLFDDTILLSDGLVVYQCWPPFIRLGFFDGHCIRLVGISLQVFASANDQLHAWMPRRATYNLLGLRIYFTSGEKVEIEDRTNLKDDLEIVAMDTHGYVEADLAERPDWATLMCTACFSGPPEVLTKASPEFRGLWGRFLDKKWRRRGSVEELLDYPFVVESFCSGSSLMEATSDAEGD